MLALFKTALGAGLVWALARRAFVIAPLLAAWVGMIGLAFGLHFGLFHLLSLAWRSRGVDAPRLMDAPLRAKSLAEFWGRRWNLGFSVPARRLLFQPLAARMGNARAALAVFLVSGWLHELVISLPARGGFGLPTAYFALQGVAGIFERSAVGRRWGLGRGWRGGLFTLAITGGPVFWLFHPPFARRVILPFLQSLGAL
jgi:alginate O-acetyltransferase complex protein AlgI